jgi:hypothetical protein
MCCAGESADFPIVGGESTAAVIATRRSEAPVRRVVAGLGS